MNTIDKLALIGEALLVGVIVAGVAIISYVVGVNHGTEQLYEICNATPL